MTTAAIGGKFDDQALLLEELRAWLPKNVWIVVKENPKQGTRFPRTAARIYRNEDFFKRIAELERVVIVPQQVPSAYLIDRSELVATVTGTAGFEALLKGKNCLVFGYAWYRKFEGVTEWDPKRTFAEATSGVNRQQFEHDCSRYLKDCLNREFVTEAEVASWLCDELHASLG
jgi:capsule polysaccharide modification protein KpsS